MRLWTINRLLRWTGVRLFIYVDEGQPTRLALQWVGLYGSAGWIRMRPKGEGGS